MSHQSLTRRGYVVKKKNLTHEQKLKIFKELCFKPFVIPAFQDFIPEKKFYTYLESIHRYYLPRYYGMATFGPPVKNTLLDKAKDTNYKVFWDLLPHQHKAWEALDQKFLKEGESGILALACGLGKCLGRGTPVLMYDGEYKNVEDVQNGDLLMGDDSTPRLVQNTNSGTEILYRITPKHGDSYVVNESHILSLIFTTEMTLRGIKYQKGDIIDLPLKEYINLLKDSFFTQNKQALQGYRVPVKFSSKSVKLDPWVLGYWLGDGYKKNEGGENKITEGKLKNKLSETLIYYNLLGNKHIPMDYKCNTRNIQLNILAGLIDSTGNLYNYGYNCICKEEKLIDDVIFLARSLGYGAYKKVSEERRKDEDENSKDQQIYYQTYIHGKGLDEIPVRLSNKKVLGDKVEEKNVLITEIEVEKLEVGDYFGFQLDGNGRFLLGDFQVTHNTFMAIRLGSFLKKKMLVVVNKEFLMNQWKEAIQKCSNARIGIIQQNKVEVENKDIVIAMLHSVAKKDYPEEIFEEFGFTVVDECFVGETEIQTLSGPTPIECIYKKWCNYENSDVIPRVRCYNQETSDFEYKKVTYAWQKKVHETIQFTYYQDGCEEKQMIECTANHKFLTSENGWMTLENIIQAYDTANPLSLLLDYGVLDYDETEISSYQRINYPKGIYVYDIEVEENHNFIVENLIAHNCHHIASQMFSQALPKIASQYMLGLSATPERKDGLTPVFLNYLGPIFYKERRKGSNQVWIKFVEIESTSEAYQEEVMKRSGTKDTGRMVTNISEFETMNHLILNIVRILVKNRGRKIIVLGSRRDQLEWLNQHCQEKSFKNHKGKFATCGLYYGNKGMNKKTYYEMLESSAECDIIFGTNEIASEGLDIPGLNTLILLQGGHDVEQAVGRILRKLHKDVPPTVIDMVYKCGNFPKHAKKRRDYYNFENYCHHKFKLRIGDESESILPWVDKLEEFLENYEDKRAKNFIKEDPSLKCLVIKDDKESKITPSQKGTDLLIESSDDEETQSCSTSSKIKLKPKIKLKK